MFGGEVIPRLTHSCDESPDVLRVSYNRRNTSIPTLICLMLWYLVWVPACAVAAYAIVFDPANYFLWFWMIFGLLGLLLFPFCVVELFTTYTFSEEPCLFRVRTQNFLAHRDLQIPKADFIAFEFDQDDGIETDQLSLVYRRNGSSTRHRLMTFLRKQAKQDVITSLSWTAKNASNTLTDPAASP